MKKSKMWSKKKEREAGDDDFGDENRKEKGRKESAWSENPLVLIKSWIPGENLGEKVE